MSLTPPIIVRLEVESMKHTIVQAISQALDPKWIEEEVGRAVEAFDFEREIRRQIQDGLPSVIEQITRSALAELQFNPELRRAVGEEVKRVLGGRPE